MTTDSRIHVLPDLLVNKIAAGEVVERPASVVKELIENALDAEGTRVTVAIEEGGRQLIRVTDDGCGMTPEELQLAVTAHATSKITEEDDLYAIATMGFRGEALASISAVSKLRIVSRRADAIEGAELRVAGKKVESSQAAGCPVGTTVEVRDLFFNVPARRRFLRSRSTEVGHINEQLARTALAHPRIGFELNNNGRVTQNLPPCTTRLERIAKFYGVELATDLLHVQRNERGVTVEAHLAPPAQSRATTQWQYTFVNNRYIRDRYIQHALKEAYRGLTDPNRHGVVFLFLTVDPSSVDVNVHPTKLEVRWADSNLIHSLVLSVIRETFQRCDLTPALRTGTAGTKRMAASPTEQDRIRREAAAAFKAATPTGRPSPAPGGVMGGGDGGESFRSPESVGGGRAAPHGGPLRFDRPMDAGETWRALYGDRESASANGDVSRGATTPPLPSDGRPEPITRAVQMHNKFLVAESENGIVIVDQHALHERVMYEQLRRRMAEGSLESQRLLLPETLSVTAHQAALLETHADLLAHLGIEVTPFGTDAVAIQAFPTLLKDADTVSFLRDLLDQLALSPQAPDPERVLHRVLDMMACKAAVKAGDPLTDEEVRSLMQQRHLLDKASSCPHGRPTMLRLTEADLDRQFKRT